MIDIHSEILITLAQAADELPRRRRGRKTHVCTLYRWTSSGCRGVVLESLQVGATRCTSREALQRFFQKLSGPMQAGTEPEPVGTGRTLAQRLRASTEADIELARMGV